MRGAIASGHEPVGGAMSEDRLGHFRIIDEIRSGRDGGCLQGALDERLDREVALKVLEPSPGADADSFPATDSRGPSSGTHRTPQHRDGL